MATDERGLPTTDEAVDGTPFDFYSDKLDNMSPQFEKMEADNVQAELAMLHRYDLAHMKPSDRLSADVLGWFLENQSKSTKYLYYDYPVNQMFGTQSQLPDFMMTMHPLKRPKDAENYIRRLSHFGAAFDQTIAGLEVRREKGIVPPRFVLDRVLKEMKDFTAHPALENPLVATFSSRIDTLKGLDETRRKDLVAGAAHEVEGTVYPAYAKLIAECECENGCPGCVGPIGDTGPHAKAVALRILTLIIETEARGSAEPQRMSEAAL